MLKSSNLITVACCLLPVACLHQSIFGLVQDLSSIVSKLPGRSSVPG
ncbi:MAG: hypothetical protein F6K31_00605 [Symploca sp. SIO2G7]|nr:hypothetical protein [Symploca sp. SIO2G7]